MNNRRTLTLIMALFTITTMAQKTINVTVTNNSKTTKTNEPVVININGMNINVKSAIVKDNGKEIACQLDDTDRDGHFDELCFLTDINRKTTKSFSVTLYEQGKPQQYEPRVFAELMLRNSKIKEKNKHDIYLTELTVNRGVDPYSTVHHHGVAFENDMLCMRVYFDHRQTIDLYGKIHKGLELKDTQFYPSKEQKATGYGDDILWVGNSFGLGAMRGWDGTKQTMVADVENRSQRIIANGPLRTIAEVEDKGWTPQPGMQPIDMNIRYTLYAGRRECTVDVKFDRPVPDYLFATGLVNVQGSTEFSDGKGLRGCWGTAWPVSLNDTANYKRETVGLGIYIPQKYIVNEEKANAEDYGYVIKTTLNSLQYKITYCSDNESFGYHNVKDWFKFIKEWKEDNLHSIIIKVKE